MKRHPKNTGIARKKKQPQGTTDEAMKDLRHDFASMKLASPRDRGARAPFRRDGRHAAFCVLAGFVLVMLSGCSTLGHMGGMLKFWSDDVETRIANGQDVRPEEIADALRTTREHMQLAPQEAYWPFHLGELYAAADSTAQAATYLQAALVTDPGYAPAASLLSKLYYQAGMYTQAVALLDDFIARNPHAPDAIRAALALHLEAMGEAGRAQSILDQCGSSKEARAARTFVSLRGDDFQTVLETAKQVLDDNPRSAANHNNYGITLLYLGRPLEARKAFMDALALNDKLPGALYNMAIVETFYFFDKDAGRQWFTRYKQYASDDPDDLESTFGPDVSKLSKPGTSK